ncbi:MAG: DUF2608 domain-containing protein, partial [bacterium]|nr:DUF2608 domain-containing protein [bacterium]
MNKGTFRNLLPDYKFAKVTKINQDFFVGATLLIFDVDNTLFFSETIIIEKEIIDWFKPIN